MVLPGPSLRASSHRAEHVERRRAADAQALVLHQAEQNRQPILVFDAERLVDDQPLRDWR